MYNEADTRAKLIDPRLHAAGWDEKRIKRDHPFTKADYLLHYNPALPLAVVEAKEEVVHPVDGLQRQAKRYSQKFRLRFAYSTNGHAIVEFDFTTQVQQSLTAFPSPDELHLRHRDYLAAAPPPPPWWPGRCASDSRHASAARSGRSTPSNSTPMVLAVVGVRGRGGRRWRLRWGDASGARG